MATSSSPSSFSSVLRNYTLDTPDRFVERAKSRLLISALFKRLDAAKAKVEGYEFTVVAKETEDRLRVVLNKIRDGDVSDSLLVEILAYATVVERLENDSIVYTK